MFGRIGIKWHIPQPCRTGSVPRAQRFCEFCSGFEKTMNGNKTLLRVGIKMKRAQWTLLVAALLASGCSWDESAYNTWVKDGELSLCMGACTFDPLDKASCEQKAKKVGTSHVRWVDNVYYCEKNGKTLTSYNEEENGNIKTISIIDKESCEKALGTWKTGYCAVRTSEGCEAVTGKTDRWTNYNLRMIDLGNGRYVRMLEDGKTIICGDYDSVVRGSALECNPVTEMDSISLIKGALEGGGMDGQKGGNNKCPKDASICDTVIYDVINNDSMDDNDPKKLPSYPAMCSVCPKDSVMCLENGAFGCYNLKNEVKHCGSCNNICTDDELCQNGKCIEIKDCKGLSQCGDDCKDFNVDPENCGECDKRCDPGQICENGSCVSRCNIGEVECGDKCIDINSNNNNCGECGKVCSGGERCENGKCINLKCDLTCENVGDDNDICVIKDNIQTCGVESCNEYFDLLSKNELGCRIEGMVCVSGECVCAAGTYEHEVDGKRTCLKPTDHTSCGANEESKGENCIEKNAHCKDGKECSDCLDGYVWCYGECINPWENDTYCGARTGCSVKRSCNDQTEKCMDGVCECKEGGFARCNGADVCVKTTGVDAKDYCGAKGTCDSSDSESPNYRGKVCGEAEECSDSGECKCKDEAYDLGKKFEGCKGCYDLESKFTCGVDKLESCPDNPEQLEFIIKKEGEDGWGIGNCTLLGDAVCKDRSQSKVKEYQCICRDVTNVIVFDNEKSQWQCVDPMTDSKHCGATNEACKDGYKCSNGMCIEVECDEGKYKCGTMCFSLDELKELNMNESCKCLSSGNNIYCNTDGDFSNGCEAKVGDDNNCGEACFGNGGIVCSDGSHCQNMKCVCPKSESVFVADTCVPLDDLNIKQCDLEDGSEGYCCADYYLDADGDMKTGRPEDIKNGCEVDIRTNVNICGSLHVDCTVQLKNVIGGTCNNGVCEYTVCKQNYDDCNNDESDGCEGDFKSIENCKKCGEVCPVISGFQSECNETVGCCFRNANLRGYVGDVVCCPGQKKFGYANGNVRGKNKCEDSDHYGCFDSTPGDGENSNCWVEME